MDEVEIRAALAFDLIDKIDLAIVSLNIQTVKEVRALLTGMKEAAKDAMP